MGTQIRPQPGPQSKFLSSSADITVYGGAAGGGKTWGLLMEPVRHKDVPGFGAVVFRRTYPQIMAQGGLWDASAKVYPLAGAVPRVSDCEWRFPSGARVKFAHLQHEKNIFDWQGSEIPLIEFDELTHFTEQQFFYLLSRNRSMCGVRPYVRATCNPDADSWVAELLAWWIDQETGQPVADRAGVLRWFVRINDRLEWADSRGELEARYPDIPPKSVSFVPAKLSDNQALMAADPGYLANLLALPMVDRERLLGGNWKIKPAAGLIFNRAWFKVVEASPVEASRCRYWDKAGTAEGGDWTAGVKMARDFNGIYYVEHVVRGQWSSMHRNQVMQETARQDGPSCCQKVEQEGGSGGKESAEISVRELAGYDVRAERVTGDKLTRARPFSAQAEAGNVRIVSGEWNAVYLDELHAFPTGKHDDQVDGSSGAFNHLALGSAQPWDTTVPDNLKGPLADAPEGVFLS